MGRDSLFRYTPRLSTVGAAIAAKNSCTQHGSVDYAPLIRACCAPRWLPAICCVAAYSTVQWATRLWSGGVALRDGSLRSALFAAYNTPGPKALQPSREKALHIFFLCNLDCSVTNLHQKYKLGTFSEILPHKLETGLHRQGSRWPVLRLWPAWTRAPSLQGCIYGGSQNRPS